MHPTILPMQVKHLEEAAELAAGRYRNLLVQIPYLPDSYADPAHIHSILASMQAESTGVVSLLGGKLIGYLCAWMLPDFLGRKAAFSPELANGVVLEGGRRILEEMYTYLAAAWTAEGIATHLVSIQADDQIAWQTWHWLGFGMIAADGLRTTEPLVKSWVDRRSPQQVMTAYDIRRAGVEDVGAVLALDTALDTYLAESPTFMPHKSDHAIEEVQTWLASSENAFWLARQDGEPVAFIGMGPASQDACTIIVDGGTTSVLGAYTLESARSRGIATTLLEHGLAWARQRGYTRCAVDFEPMNPLARRFWLRYFQPVSYTLSRQVSRL